MFFPHRHKIPSSDPIFLLSETSSHRFPRYSTLISPAAAEELTMKPRCAGFHRQFSPIPRNFPELEVHAPPEPEANHGPPKTFTGFGYAQRAFHAAEPTPKYAPPEPEANHGPPEASTGFGYAQRAFHAAEPAPKYAPPEPEANHGPPEASTGFGYAQRSFPAAEPTPTAPRHWIFPLLLEIQQINPI